ncbi:hypothetical protein GIB67_038449 [Kingdonia uniflora]|uniref:Elongator complex protein 2 n=1 Tax=Kingdonia uniflora TaxID=39325 RepID=A0A7J7NPS4_9MAGN|nr:hypothetical protein GIB67_038449 [Kingdonia uniflora]
MELEYLGNSLRLNMSTAISGREQDFLQNLLQRSQRAINYFQYEFGSGRLGAVFKGKLGDGIPIAVKKVERLISGGMGTQKTAFRQKRLMDLIDRIVMQGEGLDEKVVGSFVYVAVCCVQDDPMKRPEKMQKWKRVLQVPQQHKKAVTRISGIMISQTAAIFASTSSDCTVYVWEMLLPSTGEDHCKLSCLDPLFLGSKPMVALFLAELPGNTGRIFSHACELKGHTDWIRCLDFSLSICTTKDDSLFLVSSSQDKIIRLWKMTLIQTSIKEEEIGLASYIKGHILAAGSSSYQISLESLLIGHEDWVYSVEWRPTTRISPEDNDIHQPYCILSTSMDKTMMIWQPEKSTGIWMNVVTVGELSHCALGFYGGHWSPSGDSILAYGYGGSFHLWKNVGVDFNNWRPHKVPSGHFVSVTDAAWDRSGEYIFYQSTTRIFTPWKNEDGSSWHEIARPQVHGHDINCATMIQGKGNHHFVSGADEKVAKVFEASLSFLKTLDHAHFQTSSVYDGLHGEIQILGVNMSTLGPSQKPIYAQDVVILSQITSKIFLLSKAYLFADI